MSHLTAQFSLADTIFFPQKFNAALNFASEKEAHHFKGEIDKKLRSKQQRRQGGFLKLLT